MFFFRRLFKREEPKANVLTAREIRQRYDRNNIPAFERRGVQPAKEPVKTVYQSGWQKDMQHVVMQREGKFYSGVQTRDKEGIAKTRLEKNGYQSQQEAHRATDAYRSNLQGMAERITQYRAEKQMPQVQREFKSFKPKAHTREEYQQLNSPVRPEFKPQRVPELERGR